MWRLTVMAISSRTSYTVGTSGMAPTALSFRTTCRQQTQNRMPGAANSTLPHKDAVTSVSCDGTLRTPGHVQRHLLPWLQQPLGCWYVLLKQIYFHDLRSLNSTAKDVI